MLRTLIIIQNRQLFLNNQVKISIALLISFITLLFVLVLHSSIISIFDLAKYSLYLFVYIILPGLLLTISFFNSGRSRYEYLIFSYPVGILFEQFVFIVFSLLKIKFMIFLAAPTLSLIIIGLIFKNIKPCMHINKSAVVSAISPKTVLYCIVIMLIIGLYVLLTIYTSGHPSKNDYSNIYPDVSYILSHAHAVNIGLPPETLALKGLYHFYHYGIEIHIAAIHYITGIPYFDSLIHFAGITFILYLSTGLLVFLLRVCGYSSLFAITGTLLFFFSGNICGVPATHSLHIFYITGSYLFSLIFLIPFIYCHYLLLNDSQSDIPGKMVLFSISLAGTILAKGVLYPVLVVTTIPIIAFVLCRQGKAKHLISMIVTGSLFLFAYMFIYRQVAQNPEYGQLVNLQEFTRRINSLIAHSKIAIETSTIINVAFLLPILISSQFLWQLSLIVFSTLFRQSVNRSFILALLSLAFVFVIASLVFNFGINNSYFIAYAQLFITIAAVISLYRIYKWRFSAIVLVVVSLFALFVGFVKIWKQGLQYNRFDKIIRADQLHDNASSFSKGEYEAMLFLKHHTPLNSLIMSDRIAAPFFNYSAFSERYFYLESEFWVTTNRNLIKDRAVVVSEIYNSSDFDKIKRLIADNDIDYLVHSKRFCPIPLFANTPIVNTVFENEYVAIYKTK